MPTTRAERLLDQIPLGKFTTQVTYNRPIAGTATPSEHSYGNAIDIFGSPKDMASFAAALNKQRSIWAISTLCYDGEGSPGYDQCTTQHLDHIHVDFAPKCGTAGVPTTGTDADRTRRCNDYQEGNDPSRFTWADDLPEQGIGGIVDAATAGIVDSIGRAAIILGGVVLGGIALAIVLGDMKIKGATKVVKGIFK